MNRNLYLALCWIALGENTKRGIKAKAYFREAEVLWKELARDAPQYVQYQQFLANVQKDLKGLE